MQGWGSRVRHRGGGGPLRWVFNPTAPSLFLGEDKNRGAKIDTGRTPLLKDAFRLQSTLTWFSSSDTISFLQNSSVYGHKKPNAKALCKIQTLRDPTTHPFNDPEAHGLLDPLAVLPAGVHVTRPLPISTGQVTSSPAPPPRPPPVTGLQSPAGQLRSPRTRSSSAGEAEAPERTPPARMVLESVARIVKVQLPAYLKRLPVPESITGFARLTGNPHL